MAMTPQGSLLCVLTDFVIKFFLNFFDGDDSSDVSALHFDRFCDKVFFLNFFDGDDSSEFSALHFDRFCDKVFF